MGLVTVLRNVLGIPASWPSHGPTPSEGPSTPTVRTHTKPKIEVYGPAGIRAFVRDIFKLTHTRTGSHYTVHELLMLNEVASAPCEPADVMHANEEAGQDIFAGEDGFWRGVADGYVGSGGVHIAVDAGSIVHRGASYNVQRLLFFSTLRTDPCIGYVFRERFEDRELPDGRVIKASADTVPRTVVILGDTSNPSALVPLLATGSPVSLLIHEATDAYIPPHIDKYGTTGKNRTPASVKAKAVEKGHSTPAMAGEFARRIGAERLVLNHIGARCVSFVLSWGSFCLLWSCVQIPRSRGAPAQRRREVPRTLHSGDRAASERGVAAVQRRECARCGRLLHCRRAASTGSKWPGIRRAACGRSERRIYRC